MATIDDIISRAKQVRDNTAIGSNTATLVGGVMTDTAEHVKDLEGINTDERLTDLETDFDAMIAEFVTTKTLTRNASWQGKYIDKNLNILDSASIYQNVSRYDITGAFSLYLKGRCANSTDNPGICKYVFADASNNVISYAEHDGNGSPVDERVNVPNGAVQVYLSGTSSANTEYLPSCVAYYANKTLTKSVRPRMAYYAVSGNAQGNPTGVYYDDRVLTSTRCIVAPTKGTCKLTASHNCYLRCFCFDKDFHYLGYYGASAGSGFATLTANQPYEIKLIDGTAYYKVMLANDTSYQTSIPKVDCVIDGIDIDLEDWEIPSPRPSDGYLRICPRVLVSNPNCCDAITDDVQDSPTYLPDYGILALPENYSQFGEGVRLIIYCHGAAVNYSTSQTRFDSQDLEPDYWLAEGYAVMDVEGNPFDNVNEHFCIPQTMDCYLAAYKFVTEIFNIKTDGVFLGGRSMGGLNTLNLITPECPLKVIAACPNVPAIIPPFYWNYMSAQRREFCATHMGFVGTPPTWSSVSPMPSAEWNYLKDNFVQLAKNSPFWRLLIDLPSKDVLMDDSQNVIKSSTDNTPYMETYGNLRMKAKCPIKMFSVLDDAVATTCMQADVMAKCMENGADIAEWRKFASGGHHADTQNPNMRTSVILSDGTEMQNVPVVYIEMLNFWRRFEQEQ